MVLTCPFMSILCFCDVFICHGTPRVVFFMAFLLGRLLVPIGPEAFPLQMTSDGSILWEYDGNWWKLMEIDGNWWKLMEYVVIVVTWCKLHVVPVVPQLPAHLTRFLRGTTCNFCRATRRSKASQIGSWADNWCVYFGCNHSHFLWFA